MAHRPGGGDAGRAAPGRRTMDDERFSRRTRAQRAWGPNLSPRLSWNFSPSSGPIRRTDNSAPWCMACGHPAAEAAGLRDLPGSIEQLAVGSHFGRLRPGPPGGRRVNGCGPAGLNPGERGGPSDLPPKGLPGLPGLSVVEGSDVEGGPRCRCFQRFRASPGGSLYLSRGSLCSPPGRQSLLRRGSFGCSARGARSGGGPSGRSARGPIGRSPPFQGARSLRGAEAPRPRRFFCSWN